MKNSESIGTRNLDLDLIFWEEEKKNQPQQILDLIKKARVNLDYQGLFEEWNNARYDDFDGSLYILTKCLAVKDTES